MACYHPLTAYRERGREGGQLTFKPPSRDFDKLAVPCGQCIGCRLDRSLQWAVRCMHEAQLHEENSFITLTYSPEHVPESGSLRVEDFQKFMKRLRKRIAPKRVRFFHCGEYGEKLQRPHYHACLFGYDFPDKVVFRKIACGYLYTSAMLEELWPVGFSTVGDVTFESAAYVARYVTKKVTGEAKHGHYCNRETGEVIRPEYTTMSRRPGIGKAWFEKFSGDVFPYDEVVVAGRPVKPPRYYENLFQLEEPEVHERIKAQRIDKARRLAHDNTPARLRAKEAVKNAQFGMLKRSFEEEGM